MFERTHGALILLATLAVLFSAGRVAAQNLGLEGETGVFITPLANTAPSPTTGFGKPVVSYHFLDAGDVIGTFSWISVTEGVFGRVEFGYTRNLHSAGDDPQLSPLWHNGFNIVHGKANLVPENLGDKHNWVPGVGIGFILRTQVHNVGGVINNKDTHNGDVYLVASKTITQFKLPIILNGGVRGTNAVLWGLAGNAPNFEARGFGAAGFMLPGPAKSVIVFAAEVAQQPRHPEGLPAAIIPTTLTYDVRVIPMRERRLNLDFGVAQIANHIMPGADLKARHQFGMAISYGF